MQTAVSKIWTWVADSIKFNSISLEFQIRGAYNKFPDFFSMGTFIDSTHMKL